MAVGGSSVHLEGKTGGITRTAGNAPKLTLGSNSLFHNLLFFGRK